MWDFVVVVLGRFWWGFLFVLVLVFWFFLLVEKFFINGKTKDKISRDDVVEICAKPDSRYRIWQRNVLQKLKQQSIGLASAIYILNNNHV